MGKKNNKFKLETVFYVIAALLCLYSFYMLYESYTYVCEYATMYGTTVSEMGSDAIQYVCSAFLPFFAYAVTVFGIGAIYAAVSPKEVVAKEAEVIEPAAEECECSCCCEEKEETKESAIELDEKYMFNPSER